MANDVKLWDDGSTLWCVLLGVSALAAGMYFLFVRPGIEGAEFVNLQRLYAGQALTIAGAIFLAAAMRPRLRGPEPERAPVTCSVCATPVENAVAYWVEGKAYCHTHFQPLQVPTAPIQRDTP